MTLSTIAFAEGRRIRRLRLQVGDPHQATRTRIALEDGLASADLDDCGRLILIRRVKLPRFQREITGPAAARALEITVRAMWSQAVHGADARASGADIVWFSDRLEMLIEALSRRVQGQTLDAWFWRKAHGDLLLDVAPRVAAIFAAVLELGDELPVVRALARRWQAWPGMSFERFIRAIAEDSAVPAQTVPQPEPASGLDTGAIERLISLLTPAARQRIATSANLAGEACAVWVVQAEIFAVAAMTPESLAATPPEFSRAVVRRVVAESQARAPSMRAQQVESPTGPVHSRTEPSAAPSLATRTAADADEECLVAPPPTAIQRPPGADTGLPPWLLATQESAQAGFFMLLNAWAAIGFDEWLDAQPLENRMALRQHWFEDWARRLGLSPNDPQRLTFESVAQPDLTSDQERELARWRHITRLWLRTRARIGPASLARRHGFISVTETHVDITFALVNSDLRVRRAGLDRNPGWVPWFGRIVAFHYAGTSQSVQ
jgi:hypothetical protein